MLLFAQIDTAEFSPDLDVLIKIGKAINELKKVELLEERFLEIVLEFVPAQRGAILITDETLTQLQSVCVARGARDDAEPMRLSRTVCAQVIAEHVALLSNDVSHSHLSATESLLASRVSSLLCVPLNMSENKGLIYLDSADPAFRFKEDHLQQMTALSFLISAALANAESFEHLQEENTFLRTSLDIETSMVGESLTMREVYSVISKVAPTDSTVLIVGESGTGKELVAKAIRLNSSRREKPFTAINCAVLSETLLESELFGYEKGAFTGAMAQKKGKLELTDGGTLFLDEIGELAPNIQAKLLRVLQEREFERVGGSRPIKVDVRVIAATNRSLEEETVKGTFRRDLFFRLNVVKIKMPALRERRSDIPLLAQYFIRKHSEKCKRVVTGLSESARKLLIDHDWPGNVRELENVIERAIVLGSSADITVEDLPEDIVGCEIPNPTETAGFHQQLVVAKKRIVLEALEATDGNYTEAARNLGIHPNNLHRLIRTLGMKTETND
jgi:Nif-specific regulatory protein